MKKFLQRMLRDQRGITAIEYGLILALVALAIMSALNGFASATIDMWDNVADKVVNA
jgi:pilus assembly protein Flp/PilA